MQSNKTTASLLQPDLFPDFRTASFSPPKHSRDLCIPQRKWEFLCHTLYLGKYPFLLGPKGCGKSSVAMELADAMEMDYFGFDMGQAFKPKKMFVGGLVIGDEGKTLAVRSEFFKAFTSDRPTLIFLDELTRIPMVAANFLMTILDRRQSIRVFAIIKARMYNSSLPVTPGLLMFLPNGWTLLSKIGLSRYNWIT